MRIVRPGDTARGAFTTADASGAVNADTTPTVAVYRNGTVDNAVTTTVTNPATGAYLYFYTVPSNYTPSDVLADLVTAVVGTLTYRAWTAPDTVVQFPATALPNAAANATGGLATPVLRGGTAQAGTSSSITLDAGAVVTDQFYRGSLVFVVGGTGAGQAPRIITNYLGSIKLASVYPDWTVTPDATSVFVVAAAGPSDVETLQYVGSGVVTGLALLSNDYLNATFNASLTGSVGTVNTVAANAIDRTSFAPNTGLQPLRSGTAQGGGTLTLTLDAGASSINNFYRPCLVQIIGGTGAGQGVRVGISYNGASKVMAVYPAWTVTPDNTSVFVLTPVGPVDVETVQLDGASAGLGLTNMGNDYINNGSVFANVLRWNDVLVTLSQVGSLPQVSVASVSDPNSSFENLVSLVADSPTAWHPDILNPVRSGTAQAGTSSSITLDAGASSVNGFYFGGKIRLTGGTGAGQTRMIVNYVGNTRIAGVDRPWTTTPDATTTFAVMATDDPILDTSLYVTANLPVAERASLVNTLLSTILNGTYTVGDVFKDVAAACGGDVTGNGADYALPTSGWGGFTTQLAVTDDGNGDRTITRS